MKTKGGNKGRGRVASLAGRCREAPYASATGKVLLASLSDEEIKQRFGGTNFRRTISSLAALLVEIKTIRSQGFAANDQESDKGLFAISVPVHSASGEPAAALGVACPKVSSIRP